MFRLPPEFSSLEGKVLSSRVYPEFFTLSATDTVLNVGCGEGPQMVAYKGCFARMVGVDINAQRLDRLRQLASAFHFDNVETIVTNVESISLPDASFDVVLAVDIVEHVEHPDRLLSELFRLLKPGGRILITFPAMHDQFVEALARVKSFFVRRSQTAARAWHPDDHHHAHTVKQWRNIVEAAGFVYQAARATTMFPPLHLYGVPRFWFSNPIIHAMDRVLASVPGVRNIGQTVMMSFRKS